MRDMNRTMKPNAVAVIGASSEEGKIGNSVMKNLINSGYKGEICPINPSAVEIVGRKAYKSLRTVPGVIDVACPRSGPSSWLRPWPSAARKDSGAVLIPSGFAGPVISRAAGVIIEVGREHCRSA